MDRVAALQKKTSGQQRLQALAVVVCWLSIPLATEVQHTQAIRMQGQALPVSISWLLAAELTRNPFGVNHGESIFGPCY